MATDDWIPDEGLKPKTPNRTTSSKQKNVRKSLADAGGGWSNDIDNDDEDQGEVNIPPMIRHGNRRAAEEIIATDIPTIPTDDADDAIDFTPEIAVAPEFSINQIASFKEIEKEFTRERASQYIDPKIDIGILYHNLNLQEETDGEDGRPWDWDKLFVEIRNAVTNPTIDS